MIKDKVIYEFCKDHYYCDPDQESGERCLWEPFENQDTEQVEDHISNDVEALKMFLKANMPKEWDEQSN